MGQSVYAKPPIPYGTKVFDDSPPTSNAVSRPASQPAAATPPAP
jgi:hypothetical protein